MKDGKEKEEEEEKGNLLRISLGQSGVTQWEEPSA
jgi:hypothetical protein